MFTYVQHCGTQASVYCYIVMDDKWCCIMKADIFEHTVQRTTGTIK